MKLLSHKIGGEVENTAGGRDSRGHVGRGGELHRRHRRAVRPLHRHGPPHRHPPPPKREKKTKRQEKSGEKRGKTCTELRIPNPRTPKYDLRTQNTKASCMAATVAPSARCIAMGLHTGTRPPPKKSLWTGELTAIQKHQCCLCSPFYGRACRWAMLGELKPKGPEEKERTPYPELRIPNPSPLHRHGAPHRHPPRKQHPTLVQVRTRVGRRGGQRPVSLP